MTTLTAETLDELERLEKGADSQPWEHDCDDEKPEGIISHAETFGGIGIMWNHPHGNYRTVLATGEEFSHANARLIVAARNRLPALIAAARELLATRRALRLAQSLAGPVRSFAERGTGALVMVPSGSLNALLEALDEFECMAADCE